MAHLFTSKQAIWRRHPATKLPSAGGLTLHTAHAHTHDTRVITTLSVLVDTGTQLHRRTLAGEIICRREVEWPVEVMLPDVRVVRLHALELRSV